MTAYEHPSQEQAASLTEVIATRLAGPKTASIGSQTADWRRPGVPLAPRAEAAYAAAALVWLIHRTGWE